MSDGYEVLPLIVDRDTYEENGDLTTLAAHFTARSGIRIDLLDMESSDQDWRCFQLSEDQAELIGAALLRWAAASRRP